MILGKEYKLIGKEYCSDGLSFYVEVFRGSKADCMNCQDNLLKFGDCEYTDLEVVEA